MNDADLLCSWRLLAFDFLVVIPTLSEAEGE